MCECVYNGNLRIKFKFRLTKSVEIYSLQGQKVLEAKNTFLSVESLDAGVCFLRVEDVQGNIVTQKLLKK
ncbi:T9SS type A sorting domain-containing protein [Flavobacterium sp.]|uniref:T9SS type A sorting domain-containing protein n=1 Tax=Flavobacterium sp. TaxID=239 RepID=UPI003D09D364